MISRTTRMMTMIAMASVAAYSNAGPTVVTPALAACSKALVETLAKSEALPSYTVKAPSKFVSEMVDQNSFTVLAHNVRTKQLLAKASCKATPAGEIVSFKAIPVKS